jgi:hypothetical protein
MYYIQKLYPHRTTTKPTTATIYARERERERERESDNIDEKATPTATTTTGNDDINTKKHSNE